MQNSMFQLFLYQQKKLKITKTIKKNLKEIFYWNKLKVLPNKNEVGTNDNSNYIRELLDGSYQRNKRFFVLTYDNTEDHNQVFVNSLKKYFPPRVKAENDNIELNERNFYDQPINELIKQYDEVRKTATRQGDDYTTR